MDHVRVIFFDAAGTLFRVRGSVGEIYARVAVNHGIDADPCEVDQAFRLAFHAKPFAPPAPGQTVLAAEKAWWRDIVCRVFSDKMGGPVLDRYFEDVFETFRTACAWELYPETVDCLQFLSGHCQLAIISNFDSRLFDVLADLGIRGYFEHVTLCWHAGAAKPDARIFHDALNKMQAHPGDAFHVGDSLQDDAMGAAAAGMNAVLLDRQQKHRDWPGLRIENLGDLARIIL